MQRGAPTERTFGASVGTACLAVGALLTWRGISTVGAALIALGAVLVVVGRFAPSALRTPHQYWSRFAHVLGWINSRVLLTLFYALVMTPVGVVMRLAGRNPLRAAQTQTSWGPYSSRRRDPKHYERMF